MFVLINFPSTRMRLPRHQERQVPAQAMTMTSRGFTLDTTLSGKKGWSAKKVTGIVWNSLEG